MHWASINPSEDVKRAGFAGAIGNRSARKISRPRNAKFLTRPRGRLPLALVQPHHAHHHSGGGRRGIRGWRISHRLGMPGLRFTGPGFVRIASCETEHLAHPRRAGNKMVPAGVEGGLGINLHTRAANRVGWIGIQEDPARCPRRTRSRSPGE